MAGKIPAGKKKGRMGPEIPPAGIHGHSTCVPGPGEDNYKYLLKKKKHKKKKGD